MIRGTTPEHVFTLPIDTGLVKKVRIIYCSSTRTLVKTEADCTMDGNTIRLRLTQEDTLSFNADSQVDIQLRVLTNNDEALASNILKISVRRLLEDEVMS